MPATLGCMPLLVVPRLLASCMAGGFLSVWHWEYRQGCCPCEPAEGYVTLVSPSSRGWTLETGCWIGTPPGLREDVDRALGGFDEGDGVDAEGEDAEGGEDEDALREGGVGTSAR